MAEATTDTATAAAPRHGGLKSFWFMLSIGFRADPWRASAALAAVTIASSGPSATAYITSRLIEAVVAGDRDRAVELAVALGLLTAAWLAAGITRLDLRFRLEEATTLLVDRELITLTAGVPGLEQHERPEHLDRLELLRRQRRMLGGSVGAMVENFGVVVSVIVTTVLLASIHPVLLLLPLFGLPSLVASGWHRRLIRKMEDSTAELLRQSKHLFELGTTGPPAKELRVFGLRDELRRRFRHATETVDREFDRAAVKVAVVTTLAWAVFAAAYVGSLYFVVREAVEGRADVADVVLAVGLAGQVNMQVSSVYWMLAWLFDSLKTVGRYLRIISDAKAAAPVVNAPAPAPERLVSGIELVDVGFRYPGTDVDVLRGVSVRLPAGSTVAVVGDNGAGKSTLIKLLCGFYQPTSGSILVDGIELSGIPVDEWRARMSAGFQDFARLELIARETVGVGSLPGIGDADAVMGALDRASAADVVHVLADGLETQVGRMFDGGVELSGGQWQKLALGRAMMRERPLLLVLDEPTAALDADTEHALFERYAGAARSVAAETGGVTVLVSHRFSTVRMADLIVVVTGGTVTECGTHEALMAQGGTYAELYELQARAYR